VINSAGRLGRADVCAKLLLAEGLKERDDLANEIITMNEERKKLGETSWEIAEPIAESYLEKLSGNLAFAFGDNIPRGATGITANRLTNRYKVPSLVISFSDNIATGSLRSTRGYDLQGLLDQLGDLFVDWGGHGFAAGFSMERSKWDEFIDRLELAAKTIEFPADSGDNETIYIDAELPLSYLSPDVFKIIDRFEPYGKDNRDLVFLTHKLKVHDVKLIGKIETKHLKLVLDTGKYQWTALYWNAVDKIRVDFDKGDFVDVVFHIERNWFKGSCTAQLCVTDMKKSES
jgi:single-stranded-DNA-specific exonuclease